MSFTPVVRFRNFTLKNFKRAIELYPDMKKKLTWDDVGNIIESENNGYKRTAYQLACQLGLENRSSSEFNTQDYVYFLNDKYLEVYLRFWAKTYYAPNPFVSSNENSILIYCTAAEKLLESNNNRLDYYYFLDDNNMAQGSEDILFNIFKDHLYPIEVEKDGRNKTLYIENKNIELLTKECEIIKKEFPIIDSESRSFFFSRFSYKNFKKYLKLIEGKDIVNKKEIFSIKNEDKRKKNGENRILYGVPGSGKSYEIENRYEVDKQYLEKIVFHPEYTSFDFLGQILPTLSKETGKLVYEFIPGPFTKILKKAIYNPTKMHYLIIEEINRGNAAAIFGDVFLLLDREDDGKSTYFINNQNISNEIYGIEDIEIYIPSNLTILGTMNTSDQNIFTLDTAFQRRWNMELIFNDIKKCKHSNKEILNTNLTWQKFAETINDMILESSLEISNMEDKRLGAYFVTEDEIKYDNNINSSDSELKQQAQKHNNLFPEKVIRYLWTDVFKYNKGKIFKDKYKSLEDVIKDFQNDDIGMNVFKIEFKDDSIERNKQ